MYKYFEITEENNSYLESFKKEHNLKTDKAALNKIIEEFRNEEEANAKIIEGITRQLADIYNSTLTKVLASQRQTETDIHILKDVANTFLSREGIENCILSEVIPSPVFRQSEEYYRYNISKAKQKKDNSAKK